MENNLPDFMKYKDDYTSEGFIDKISRIAKRAGAKLVYVALILYYTLQSNDVSVKDKAIIIGALGYLMCGAKCPIRSGRRHTPSCRNGLTRTR